MRNICKGSIMHSFIKSAMGVYLERKMFFCAKADVGSHKGCPIQMQPAIALEFQGL
jgi:hypothetical protein